MLRFLKIWKIPSVFSGLLGFSSPSASPAQRHSLPEQALGRFHPRWGALGRQQNPLARYQEELLLEASYCLQKLLREKRSLFLSVSLVLGCGKQKVKQLLSTCVFSEALWTQFWGVCFFWLWKIHFRQGVRARKDFDQKIFFRFLRFPPNILSIRGMLICQK